MEETKIRFDEVNLRLILQALVKNLWVILLFCASAILCFAGYETLSYKPVYTASATLMVSAKDSTSAYNSLTTTQSMATVFVEVFQSNVLREKVAEEMPQKKFDGTITTATIPETNLLMISVTSPSPQTAFQGLNLVLDNYESISDYLFSNAQLEVIKSAEVPTTPSNTQNLSQYYPLVIFLTALVGVGAVVLLQVMRKTVQTPAAARRHIDARMLRVIRHEKKYKTLRAQLLRKNTALLINAPLITKQFIEDNLSLCSSVEYHMRKHGQKVIMITSVGENEGKSTVVTNLALALAEKNKKVLLLDCDFRKPSLHKIFEHPVAKSNAFSSYLLQEFEEAGSYLVEKDQITLGLSRADHKNITNLLHNGKLNAFLQQARRDYDYILLDTPPMLAAADVEVIGGMVDTTMVVVSTDFMPIAVINDWLDNLRKSTPEVCGVVMNDYRKNLL